MAPEAKRRPSPAQVLLLVRRGTPLMHDDDLYVRLEPLDGPTAPLPHPVRDGQFDAGHAYRVMGTYDLDEPGRPRDRLFVLSNTHGQVHFISGRHLRTAGRHRGGEPFIALREWHDRDDCHAAGDVEGSIELLSTTARRATAASRGDRVG